MEKKFFPKMGYALLLAALMATGCHKFVDWDDLWHKHNPNCRIEKILYYPEFGPDTITAIFSYNKKGDPVSVLYDFVATGRPNLLFRYDQKGRLTDYIGVYTNNHYEFWYHYRHDQKGRIIADTVSGFGQFINGQPIPDPNFPPSWGTYEYDEFDRVSSEEHHHPQGFVTMDTYEYNGDANLISHKNFIDGHLNYEEAYTNFDGKVSLYRTNKIWMFVDRNYGKNGFVLADKYNSKGLPLKYNLDNPVAFTFLRTELARSEITYSCR